MHNILFWLILFQMGQISVIHTQSLEWKAGAEGGYFHAGGNYNSSRIKFVSALPVSARFEQPTGTHVFIFNARLRPEWYGPQKNNYNIQASAGFQYQRRWKEFDFGAGIQGRKQNYHIHTDPISIHTLQISASASWSFIKNMSAGVESGYIDAALTGDVKNTVLTKWVSPGLHYFFHGYGSLSVSGYVEAFEASTNDVLTNVRSVNGWRAGPKIGLEYLRKNYITLNYLLAQRRFERSNKFHPEHEINFVAGKNLTQNWSVFILADYYIRDIESTAGDPVYSQTNYENRIHAKLVYNWKKDYSIFVKMAYSKNEFIHQKISLSGTQVSLGFEIQK